MERTIDLSFASHPRLKDDIRVELFNGHYLRYQSELLKKRQSFDIDIAILDPKGKNDEDSAIHWMAAAILFGLSNIYFIYRLISELSIDNLLLAGGALLITGAIAAGLVALFYRQSIRSWTFYTLSARYPLVEIIYRPEQRAEAARFAEALSSAIYKTLADKGHSSDTLFAGEMRMLRRLADSKILTTEQYDLAKAHMMKSHGG